MIIGNNSTYTVYLRYRSFKTNFHDQSTDRSRHGSSVSVHADICFVSSFISETEGCYILIKTLIHNGFFSAVPCWLSSCTCHHFKSPNLPERLAKHAMETRLFQITFSLFRVYVLGTDSITNPRRDSALIGYRHGSSRIALGRGRYRPQLVLGQCILADHHLEHPQMAQGC